MDKLIERSKEIGGLKNNPRAMLIGHIMSNVNWILTDFVNSRMNIICPHNNRVLKRSDKFI